MPNRLASISPRFVHDSSRATLIEQAIQRYLDAGREIPIEWTCEYLEILNHHHLEPRFDIIVRPRSTTHRVTTETRQP